MTQEKRSALALTLAGFFCLGIPISGNHWCFSVFVLPLEAEFGCAGHHGRPSDCS